MSIPILLFYLLMGTVGVAIIPQPESHMFDTFIGPFQSLQHPLGTDGFGQPIFPQLVHATPAMFKMLLAGAIFASAVAVLIGLVSGFKGGSIDTLLMTFTDIVLTMPGLPLIIFLTAIYPPRDPFLVGILLAIDNWPGLARSIRSQVLSIRESEFIEAARTMDISTSRILTHDVLPQMMPYIMINSAGTARSVITESVALYFLGILPFTTFNWGVMMNMANEMGAVADPGRAGHWLLWPALALSLLGFALTLFSQSMDRVWNPRLRARHSETVSSDDDDNAQTLSPMD
ncbi:ABC transporter permease [Halosimplex pelagicum]|uniref:ABC transporter permease n=1 Tax=Halosimplex pelagicum TaxID=869886 RepID=UPI001C54E8B2|nr:ABC transporter permease [Halosimplex pelagicum]